jgi:hypothetical protein
MKALWKILKFAIYGFGIIILALIVLEIFFPTITNNAKGNRLALIECRVYLNTIVTTKTNSTSFDFSKLDENNIGRAIGLAAYLDFLIKTNFVWGTSSNREIVIVCPKQFDNIHKQGFWNSFSKNPAHAVGYSDGSMDLISPEQFTNLNLNDFISATNLTAQIFKK